MSSTAKKIPQSFDCREDMLAEIARLRQEIETKNAEIIHLNQLITLANHRVFGRSSEKYSGMKSLFDEAEEHCDDDQGDDDETDEEQTAQNKPKKKKRGKPKRRPLPPELPRKDVVVEIPEEDRLGCDGKPLKKIGEEVSEHLEIQPAKFTVVRTIRHKYGKCECESCLKTAPLPAKPIPKSIAGASLLAFIVTAKYCDGLPLKRLSDMFQRSGIDISIFFRVWSL